MAGEFEIVENLAGWKAIERAIETLRSGGSYVKIGVVGEKAAEEHDSEEHGSRLTNAALAAIHEFGTEKIPARPFILGTFSMNEARYRRMLAEEVLPAVLRLKLTPAQGLKILGQLIAMDMRNRMVDGAGIPPPLSDATMKAKIRRGKWNAKSVAKQLEEGADLTEVTPRPLVDTGRLRNAISYAVVIQEG